MRLLAEREYKRWGLLEDKTTGHVQGPAVEKLCGGGDKPHGPCSGRADTASDAATADLSKGRSTAWLQVRVLPGEPGNRPRTPAVQVVNARPHAVRPARCRPSPNARRVGSCIIPFEACSAFTRVAACRLAESPRDPLHQRLRRLRCLRRRSDCFRPERPSCRAGSAPAENRRLSRRTGAVVHLSPRMTAPNR